MTTQSPYLLIFDCDGTLVDSERLVNKFFVDLVNDFGVPLTYEEAWNHFPGTTLRLCMDYVEQKFNFTFPDDFVDSYRHQQIGLFKDNLQPIPGAKNCLEQLDSFDMCVASNGPLDIITANLVTTNLASHFDLAYYSAYTLNVWKPDPRLFLHAANHLGYEPSKCIVVEDSEAGITAGINAGMKVFNYLAPDHQPIANLAAEVEVFQDMSKLPSLIRAFVET